MAGNSTRLYRDGSAVVAFGLKSKSEFYKAPGATPEEAAFEVQADIQRGTGHPSNQFLLASEYVAGSDLGFAPHPQTGQTVRFWEVEVRYEPFGNPASPIEEEDRTNIDFVGFEQTSQTVAIPTPFIRKRRVAVPGDLAVEYKDKWETEWRPVQHPFAVWTITVNVSSMTSGEAGAIAAKVGTLHEFGGLDQFGEDKRWEFINPVVRKINPSQWNIKYQWRHDPGTEGKDWSTLSRGDQEGGSLINLFERRPFESYQVGYVTAPPGAEGYYTYTVLQRKVDADGYVNLPGDPIESL
jgi:hypothetical protein